MFVDLPPDIDKALAKNSFAEERLAALLNRVAGLWNGRSVEEDKSFDQRCTTVVEGLWKVACNDLTRKDSIHQDEDDLRGLLRSKEWEVFPQVFNEVGVLTQKRTSVAQHLRIACIARAKLFQRRGMELADCCDDPHPRAQVSMETRMLVPEFQQNQERLIAFINHLDGIEDEDERKVAIAEGLETLYDEWENEFSALQELRREELTELKNAGGGAPTPPTQW